MVRIVCFIGILPLLKNHKFNVYTGCGTLPEEPWLYHNARPKEKFQWEV
jgi:hypothetical protein